METRLVLAMFLIWGFCLCLAAPPSFIHPTSHLAQATPGLTCPNTTISCAGKGDSCTGGIAGCNSTNSTCCGFGLYCINKTCAVDNMGDACTTTAQCMPSFTGTLMSCMSGACTYLYGPGDECTNSSDCYGGLMCANGTCQGVGMNEPCAIVLSALGENYPVCAWGLFCGPNHNVSINATLTCQQTVGNGGNCSALTPCAYGNTCVQGKCVADFSQGAGTTCVGNSCDTDYYCASNNTCVPVSTSYMSCTNSTDCTTGGICICSPYSGDQFCSNVAPMPCNSQMQNLETCLKDNNCTTGANDSPDSCCYNNCYSSFKKANSCGCSAAETAAGNCFYNSYCSGFPIWAIIVIIVVAILLVLAVVLLVFFMMRRRRQYDSI